MDDTCFLTDLYIPQMLYALTIRSPVARGRLVSIESPILPGSYRLITARDIPGKNRLDDTNLPILAYKEVNYIGEPVALLLGPDKNTLGEFARQCNVIVEETEPVFESAGGTIAEKRDMCVGDPETAFNEAASIVSGSYSSGIQEHWYAEPTGAVAWLDETRDGVTRDGIVRDTSASNTIASDGITVRTATQWPFHVKRSVAQVLGLFSSGVQVIPTITGLHMDGKLWYPSFIACHAALGALLTRKPVRLTLTRREDFSFSPKRCGAEINIRSALGHNGEITGIDINATVNLGSYAVNAAEILDHVNLGCIGGYKTKNIRFSGTAVKTNIPPQGPFAGFGLAQGFFALERHVSHIADTLNQDPAQWRKNNFSHTGTLPHGLPLKDTVSMEQLIDTTARMSDYSRKWASYELLRRSRKSRQSGTEKGESLRGIGIAAGYQASGLLYTGTDRGNYAVELLLEKDGSLEIKTSMAHSGTGCSGMWIDIASGILGVAPGMIRVSCNENYPDCGPLTVSRGAVAIARLVEQGCLSIRKKRFRDPLPISVRKTLRPQKSSHWENFPVNGQVPDYSGFIRPGWATAVVEIEISPIEYLPRIRGVWLGIDGGKIVSEDSARRSLKTSAVQALGWAYRERINYTAGAIPADQFENFDIPSPREIPPITIDFIWNNSDGPKGIGDLPFNCIPAAYAQAVSQAMDCQFESIPLGAMDVWLAGKENSGGRG